MKGITNPRIIGACIIGCALVAGAYTLSNFGVSRFAAQQSASVAVVETTPRVAITVTDNDQNGIEDWRDEFVTNEPIVLAQTDTTYEPPDTLTGQMGVNFIEGYLRSKTYGPFGSSREEVTANAVEVLSAQTAHELYDTPDITIMNEWDDEDIRTYANTMALAISNNNQSQITESELFILHDIVTNDNVDRIEELELLANTYQQMRDTSLNIPVPAIFVKEHLDLINTYHAIHKDIDAMTLAINDPAFALMRLKRYEDDAAGLGYALENMYQSLNPYASLIQPNDPAALFVVFSSEYKS
jgi:hypothetical protein